MPQTVAQADSRYRLDWTKWPVPTMPNLPAEAWAGVDGCFWRDEITKWGVDTFRTNALPNYDVGMGAHAGAPPWQGSTYGMPFQLINSASPTTAVWDLSRPITWNWWTPTLPLFHVPLPSIVLREGDPGGSSDMHWYGYDLGRKVLYESILLQSSPLNRFQTWNTTDWVCSYNGGGPGVSRWDTSKKWDAPGQPWGTVAANIPQFPLIARWEEIQKGRINHCLFGVLPNYSPEKVAPARGSDGSWKGHPVRAGERLRLRRSVVERFSPGTAARVIAQALYEFGWIQADRNGPDGTSLTGSGGFNLTMDRRWTQGDGTIGPLGSFALRLKDFEVVSSSIPAVADTYGSTYQTGY